MGHPVVVLKKQFFESSLPPEQLNVSLELGEGIARIIMAIECEPADLAGGRGRRRRREEIRGALCE